MRCFECKVGFLISLATLIQPLIVAADDKNANGAVFLYPPAGLAPKFLDTINTTWTSFFQTPYLYTNCRNETGDIVVKKHYAVPTNGSSAVVLDFKNLTSCWFNIRPQDYYIADSGSNSEAWVIVPGRRDPLPKVWTLDVQDPAPGSSTSTAENTTNTSTASVAEATSTQPHSTTSVEIPLPTIANVNSAATTAANLQQTVSHQHGLGNGAKAGIGISITIIVLGSASLAFYLLARRSQHREMTLSNHTSQSTFPPPEPPVLTRVMSSTPSYHSTAPITRPYRALLDRMKLEEEQGMSPQIPAAMNESERSDSPSTQSVIGSSLRQDSYRDDSIVELSHVDSALHELYSPVEIHEIGPGRWENTGFHFPPEKSARC